MAMLSPKKTLNNCLNVACMEEMNAGNKGAGFIDEPLSPKNGEGIPLN